jgi:uncharacterized OB-fold protein
MEAGKCTVCGKICYPPRLICPVCQARTFEQVTLPLEGKLLTFTVIRVAPSKFVDQAPYAIGLVETEGGGRLMAQIVDCDPDRLAIGQKVKLEFRKISADGEAGIICYGHKGVPA